MTWPRSLTRSSFCLTRRIDVICWYFQSSPSFIHLVMAFCYSLTHSLSKIETIDTGVFRMWFIKHILTHTNTSSLLHPDTSVLPARLFTIIAEYVNSCWTKKNNQNILYAKYRSTGCARNCCSVTHSRRQHSNQDIFTKKMGHFFSYMLKLNFVYFYLYTCLFL